MMERRTRWVVLGAAGALVLALPVAGLADHYFDDVDDDNPHAEGIEFVAEYGITRGCDPAGTRFCPTDRLTRQQMATFLFRSSGLDPDIGPVFDAVDSMLINGDLTFTGLEDFDLDGGETTECATTNMGEPVEMDLVVIDHQLTGVPAGVPSEVNVAPAIDREDTDGSYDVCFTRVDGGALEGGTYETTFQASIFLVDAEDFGAAGSDDRGIDRETAEALAEARSNR
jgi:hypothetical protein